MATYIDHSNAGAEVTLDAADGKTKWLLENGYISEKTTPKTKGVEERGKYATSTPASEDPTLAVNRENPVPASKMPPHIANADMDTEGGGTVLGNDRGLDAKVDKETAPKVAFKSHKDAGKDGAVEHPEEQVALKKAIDKDTPNPPEPKLGRDDVAPEPENASLKDEIDKQQPDVTTPVPR